MNTRSRKTARLQEIYESEKYDRVFENKKVHCSECGHSVTNVFIPALGAIFHDDYDEVSYAKIGYESYCQDCLRKAQRCQTQPDELHDICDICGEDLSEYDNDIFCYDIGGQTVCEECLKSCRRIVRE